MSKLTIQSGKSELNLRKSSSLVGLKTNEKTNTADQDYVEKEVIKNLGGFNVCLLYTSDAADE